MKQLAFVFSLFLLLGCSKEYHECGTLGGCSGSANADYCLFGYKWGERPQFRAGINAPGPQLPGGIVSFSFQTDGRKVSIHNRQNKSTLSFDEKGACAREEVRKAFEAYAEVADISFVEWEDDTNADIQFFVVKDEKPNVGNPNYQHQLCSDISGYVVYNESPITNCHNFFILSLHEIGHVLGLGHVSTANVMMQSNEKYEYDGLQSGDIAGVRAIYGAQ